MNRLMNVLFVLLIATATVFAGGQSEQAEESALSGQVKIAGSSTVYPISVAVAEEFARMHPDVEIPVQSTGTGGGFSNFFIPGKTDINDASRPIKDSEREQAMANGVEPIELQVATDALTFVANPDADWLNDVTVEELGKIWGGESPAQTWSDVRAEWPSEPLELFGPTAASGTFDYFMEVMEEMVDEDYAYRDDQQGTEQDNTIIQAVSGSEYAMGYFGLSYYLEAEGQVKSVAVNGVEPGLQTARSGDYTPFSRPLFIYVSKSALERPEVREYVRYYLELTNTSFISEIGYVPVPDEVQEANMAKFEEALADLGVE